MVIFQWVNVVFYAVFSSVANNDFSMYSGNKLWISSLDSYLKSPSTLPQQLSEYADNTSFVRENDLVLLTTLLALLSGLDFFLITPLVYFAIVYCNEESDMLLFPYKITLSFLFSHTVVYFLAICPLVHFSLFMNFILSSCISTMMASYFATNIRHTVNPESNLLENTFAIHPLVDPLVFMWIMFLIHFYILDFNVLPLFINTYYGMEYSVLFALNCYFLNTKQNNTTNFLPLITWRFTLGFLIGFLIIESFMIYGGTYFLAPFFSFFPVIITLPILCIKAICVGYAEEYFFRKLLFFDQIMPMSQYESNFLYYAQILGIAILSSILFVVAHVWLIKYSWGIHHFVFAMSMCYSVFMTESFEYSVGYHAGYDFIIFMSKIHPVYAPYSEVISTFCVHPAAAVSFLFSNSMFSREDFFSDEKFERNEEFKNALTL